VRSSNRLRILNTVSTRHQMFDTLSSNRPRSNGNRRRSTGTQEQHVRWRVHGKHNHPDTVRFTHLAASRPCKTLSAPSTHKTATTGRRRSLPQPLLGPLHGQGLSAHVPRCHSRPWGSVRGDTHLYHNIVARGPQVYVTNAPVDTWRA